MELWQTRKLRHGGVGRLASLKALRPSSPTLTFASGETGPERGELTSQMSQGSAVQEAALVTRRECISVGTPARPGGPDAGILSSPDENGRGPELPVKDTQCPLPPPEGT